MLRLFLFCRMGQQGATTDALLQANAQRQLKGKVAALPLPPKKSYECSNDAQV